MKYVYIGISLPQLRLKNGTVFKNSLSEILEHFNDAIARYPQIKKLFVPIDNFAELSRKTCEKGNALYEYCKQMKEGNNL